MNIIVRKLSQITTTTTQKIVCVIEQYNLSNHFLSISRVQMLAKRKTPKIKTILILQFHHFVQYMTGGSILQCLFTSLYKQLYLPKAKTYFHLDTKT